VALIVLDTSVLVALLDRRDALHESAAEVLAEAWDGGDEVLVPSICYGEAMVRPLEQGGEALARADAFFSSQTVVPIDRSEAREAARLRGLHRPWLRMPDALVLATGLLRDATVLTGDARWTAVSPLTRLIATREP
jgi:predicted nucleic acid-binding protein